MEELLACVAKSARITDAPREIKLLPLGMVKTEKGDFLVDEESYRLMKEEFDLRRLDKVIDYEHQTLDDVQAPAAGWIKELRLSEDAIVAEVDWTRRGAEYLREKEYRYLSPVIKVRKTDRRAAALHSVALTNTPAIDGMFTIANKLSFEDEGGSEMDVKELARLLGLPEDAGEEQIKEALARTLAEVKELKEQEKPAADPVVCKLLGVEETAKTEDVTAAIMALKSGGGETVSKAEYLALKRRLDERDSEELVELALKAGKIAPAQKEWAMEYAVKDPAGFQAFTDKAPKIVEYKEVSGGDPKEKKTGLSDGGWAVCKALGVSKEDIEKYGKDGETC